MQDLRDASQTPLSSPMLLWYNNNTRHVRQHLKSTVAVTAASTPLQQQQVLQNSINNREYRPRAASLTRSHKNRGTASTLQHDTVVGSESQHRQLQMPEPNIHSHRYAYAQKSLQNGHCQSRRNLVRYHLSQQRVAVCGERKHGKHLTYWMAKAVKAACMPTGGSRLEMSLITGHNSQNRRWGAQSHTQAHDSITGSSLVTNNKLTDQITRTAPKQRHTSQSLHIRLNAITKP